MKKRSTDAAKLCALLCVLCLGLAAISGAGGVARATAANSRGLTETVLGIGGGGAVFTPKISPFDRDEVAVTVDMGGIYVSHDAGQKWSRKNLDGLALTVQYDPTRKGVVYAGGSGLYRSVDNGDSFELFFPKKDDLSASLNNAENNMRYLYSRSGIYPTDKAVKDVSVNPADPDNVFILTFSFGAAGRSGAIYETRDGGQSFEQILSYTMAKRYSTNIIFELNKLFYRQETDTLYFATSEGVYKCDKAAKTAEQVYSSQEGIVDITAVYENGRTEFIVIENGSVVTGCKTRLFYTRDFTETEDITQKAVAGFSRSITNGGRETEYKWAFAYLDATSTDNIYLAQASYADDRSVYAYGIEGILHYNGEGGEWIYGNNPAIDGNAKNQMSLKNRAWSDGNYKPYGLAVSRQSGCENTVLSTTITGVYYSSDGKDFYQRYCDVIRDGNAVYYATTGLDEQTTYGIAIDPFDKNNVFIPNTDLGLIRSKDGAKTWQRANAGVPSGLVFNCYDVVFDPRNQGVVYSLWSNRHDVPYSAGNESGKAGAFLYSSDGGMHWDAAYSAGIPADATPVKMSVVFPDDKNADAVVYVATFNRGFFVSRDSGKTFEPLNDGITPVTYNATNSFILGSDIEAQGERVFALTAKSGYGGATQAGEVFELKDGSWHKIGLPDGVHTPRDIYFHDNVLYISCTTDRKFTTATEFYNYAGGVYAYRDGQTQLIFDESVSATGVQIDSRGTTFVSDINGNIYRKEVGGEYEKIYDKFHTVSKGIQLCGDNELYLATLGGGLLKLEGLRNLYSPAPKGKGRLALWIGLSAAVVAAAAVAVAVVLCKRRRAKS